MFAVAILVSSLTGRRKEIRGEFLVGSATQVLACALLLFLGDGAPSPTWAAIVASASSGASYGQRASTHGLHELAVFLLVIAVLFFALTLVDRSLHQVRAAGISR